MAGKVNCVMGTVLAGVGFWAVLVYAIICCIITCWLAASWLLTDVTEDVIAANEAAVS
jgi:hypothetical protein